MGDTVAAPIGVLTAAPELGHKPVVSHQMGSGQAREMGTRLLRYADRLDAEGGAAVPDLRAALDIALSALSRAIVVIQDQPTVQRDDATLTRVGRELSDSHAEARRKVGTAGFQ